MPSEAEILRLIQEDSASAKKQNARKGQAYYEGEHDIKNYRLYYYNADGTLVEDKTRSNIKISHPFLTELIDQKVQYTMSGKNPMIRSDDAELQTLLDEYFNENEDYTRELYEVLTGASAKGFEYMYAYKNAEGKTSFQCADSLGVVEVRAKDTDDNCEYVIYWYYDRIDKGQKKIKRIQVWDSHQTFFYVSEDDGKIEKDTSQEINPRPHTLYRKKDGGELYYEDYGFIPFFRLDNNKKQFSDLKPIKHLIDDYDLMSCGLSNNLQDASEYLVVVKGFQGDNLDELQKNVKTKKIVGVDSEGGVEVQTVDVPYEARKAKLELDEKNIYRFGFGLNTSGLKDTSATTNIAIKAAYSLLDLKCSRMIIKLKQFLRKLVRVVLAEINANNGTDYQQKDVYFKFEPEIMSNATENAQIEKTEAEIQQIRVNTILNIAANVGDEQTLKAICEVMEWDYEDLKGQVEKMREEQNTADAKAMLEGVATDEETEETFPAGAE